MSAHLGRRPAEHAIRGNQRQSEAIRRHQRSSDVISAPARARDAPQSDRGSPRRRCSLVAHGQYARPRRPVAVAPPSSQLRAGRRAAGAKPRTRSTAPVERDALHQWSSVVISGHQSTCGKGCPSWPQSVAASGHQWPSDAIRRHQQWLSADMMKAISGPRGPSHLWKHRRHDASRGRATTALTTALWGTCGHAACYDCTGACGGGGGGGVGGELIAETIRRLELERDPLARDEGRRTEHCACDQLAAHGLSRAHLMKEAIRQPISEALSKVQLGRPSGRPN